MFSHLHSFRAARPAWGGARGRRSGAACLQTLAVSKAGGSVLGTARGA